MTTALRFALTRSPWFTATQARWRDLGSCSVRATIEGCPASRERVNMNSAAASEQELESADSSIRDLSNDALIIRLIQTLNHLSRWLTPIHDRTVLEFSPRRSEPSVKELLLRMRDTETRAYGFMNAIASERDPDLDRIPRVEPSAAGCVIALLIPWSSCRSSGECGRARRRCCEHCPTTPGNVAALAARSGTGRSASWRSIWLGTTERCCNGSTCV